MDVKKYLGNPLQLYGVEEYRLQGGKGDGMRLMRVRNGKGIDLTICPDRCADISELYFDGCRINYTSPNGYVSPQYFQVTPNTNGFLNNWYCGLITSCGFDNIGVPNTDGENVYGLHGTLGNIPANHIYYEVKEDRIEIHAEISDERIFGRKFLMKRLITVSLEENFVSIDDVVENTGDTEDVIMVLYHIQAGYPLLSETAQFSVNSCRVTPRDDHAAEDLDTWNKILTPTANFQEQCYYHEFDGEKACASLANPSIGKKLTVSFDPSQFPYMTEWKMMGEREYVLGMEPCTNTLEGRTEVGKKGNLKTLKPGERACYSVRFDLERI